MVALREGDLRARARGVKLVVSDVDGVLTDGAVFCSERGEEYKRFSLRDGMGVERLRDAGIETAFLTRETSGFTLARAAKLGVVLVYVGVRDKRAHLTALTADTGLSPREMAYIGDDVNDIEIMRAVMRAGGLSGAPADAFAAAAGVALYRTRASAGNGAFREFAEWILDLRGAG